LTGALIVVSQHQPPTRYVYPGAPILVIIGLAIAVIGG
jgi:hypothetical protein